MFGPNFTPEDDVPDYFLNNDFGNFSKLNDTELSPIRPDFTGVDINNDGKLDFVFTDVLGNNSVRVPQMLTIAN